MATHVKATQPKEYYRKFLEQNVRPDGRELGEARPTILNIGSITTAEGSALVKQGNTTVICGIKAEISTPKVETPKKGYVVPNVDLPPLCSAQFRPGPPSEQAQVASKVMQEIITSSKCINEEDLCIEEGKVVWVLYCDMMCLDYDGNILDACATALLAALKTLELPGVKMNEESGQAESDIKQKQTIPVRTQPVATSFAIFDEKVIFVDPTSEEESLATGGVTIVTQEDGSLCKVYKPGGSVLTDTQMDDCIHRAHQRAKEVRRLIDETILNVHR